MGNQRNKYDWYVMNKIIKRKQSTILWHVNNLKMTHIDSETVAGVISDIDTWYGKIEKMTTTRGKINKYLGMTIKY